MKSILKLIAVAIALVAAAQVIHTMISGNSSGKKNEVIIASGEPSV